METTPTSRPATSNGTNGDARNAAAAAIPASVPHTLDELLDLDAAALEALYQGARVPRLTDVSGDLRGRMLASPVVEKLGPLAGWLRAFAGSRSFPWRGKTFSPGDEARGEGVNRVVRDRWHLFRFLTSIGPSRAGSFDALQLDYDLPGNPYVIRIIKDELRELRPGLYLGQMWVGRGEHPTLGLYFGLEK